MIERQPPHNQSLLRTLEALGWIGQIGLRGSRPIGMAKWRRLLNEGMPLVEVGGSTYFCPALWWEWIQRRTEAALQQESRVAAPKRGRGRPRKQPVRVIP